MATGALAGAASGAVMTGTLKGTMQGALFGAIGAGVAFGIGEAMGHAGGIFNQSVSFTKAMSKALAHGISRGVISMAQGGTFRAGFASGFAASFFNPGTTLGGDGTGGFTLRTAIAAIAGGTASEIGGGKFANGAVSGAFVHMFNAEYDTLSKALKGLWDKSGEIIDDIGTAIDRFISEGIPKMWENSPAYAKGVLLHAGGVVVAPIVYEGELLYINGTEFRFGNNVRIAPFGNRTGHPTGKFPHYHRRGLDMNGEIRPGQGLKRHRPWDTKSTDTSFWDRF